MRLTSSALPAVLICLGVGAAEAQTSDTGTPVDHTQYQQRPLLPDFTAAACPDTPRGLTQVNGNLYRHTTGAGLAVHSGFVLI